jgi:SP family xylose:H+ symportor-like MFS transporter
MQIPGMDLQSERIAGSDLHVSYIVGIASIAALGGLLFGYDWVVIGGAKPFYEAYFQLHSEQLIGWANSCALLGCLLGSLAAGAFSDRFGRKWCLIGSALLFALSSILTGWTNHFAEFVLWRIAGGVAIGLASNVSPTYIAEISPAPWRGRLVSLNQLALVVGILGAQIVNWLIAQKTPEAISAAAFEQTWNVQSGWRWMFTAVAVPAVIFLLTAIFIPESPRWLLTRGEEARARRILVLIGGENYATEVLCDVRHSLAEEVRERAQWRELLAPGLRRVLLIGVVLAVLQQWSGINVLFNYAEEIYRSAGYGVNQIMFNIVITGTINLFFTLVAIGCVDRFGRRSLMLWGCAGIGISHLLAAFAYWRSMHGTAVLVVTLGAIACYAVSLAPITWVLITEIFPNRVRGMAVSVAVSALWAAAFLLTYTFPLLNRLLGTGGTFFSYGIICIGGGIFVFLCVPETRGRSLEQIEESMLAKTPGQKPPLSEPA